MGRNGDPAEKLSQGTSAQESQIRSQGLTWPPARVNRIGIAINAVQERLLRRGYLEQEPGSHAAEDRAILISLLDL